MKERSPRKQGSKKRGAIRWGYGLREGREAEAQGGGQSGPLGGDSDKMGT